MYEINGLEYIFIVFNLLIVGAVIYFLYFRESIIDKDDREPIIENIDFPSLDDIGKKISGPFNEIGDQMKNGVNSVINGVKDKILGPLEDIFNKAKQAFTEIPRRFSMFGSAFSHIFIGIGEEVTGLFSGIGDGFMDIGELFKYSGILVFTYVECGVKLIGNLHRCMFYYALETLGKIAYLPFRILLWGLNRCGIDLYSVEKKIWDTLEWLDGNLFRLTRVHFMHYTIDVRNMCYNCKRLKTSALDRRAKRIDDDFRTGIKRKLNKGIDTLRNAGDEFKGAFM